MNKRKKLYGLLSIVVILTILISIGPVRNKIQNFINYLLNNDSNKTINVRFTYKDSNGNELQKKDKIYVFISENSSNNFIGLELEANGETKKISSLYDQNGTSNNQKIENKEYKVIVATPKKGRENDFQQNKKYDFNSYDEYKSGDSYNGSYTITFQDKIEFNGKDEFDLNIEVNERSGQRLSSSEILEPMNLATSFGIFALTYSQSADVEATVGVQTFEKNGNETFGLSDNNYDNGLKKVNEKTKIVVDKNYEKNNNPLSGKEVKIVLLKDNQTVKDETCKTDNDGKCSVIFKDVDKGTYKVGESINGKIVSINDTVVDESGNSITVKFNNNSIELKEFSDSDKIGYNYNYIEKVGTNEADVHLEKMRTPGTLVLGSKDLVDKYEKQQEFSGKNVTVVEAGTNGYDRINFEKEFENLRKLSVKLSTAIDSEDVKVYYMKPDDVKKSEIDFISEGKEYILVNVDCGNKNEVSIGQNHTIDGHDVMGDSFVYNDGAKLIYNFYSTTNNETSAYSNTVNLNSASATTGIILAPDADVDGASGNHSGTIIAKDYDHTHGEVHQRVIPKWISLSNSVSITNTLTDSKSQKIEIAKVDANKNPIEGAELQLLDKDKKVIAKWTSTKLLYTVPVTLNKGESYTIKETKAPEGYQLAQDYTFTYDGQATQTYTMVNTKIIANKYDEQQKYLVGATLQIVDSKNNVIEQWISDGKEHIVKQNLNIGQTYYLREKTEPVGYKKAKDVEFVVQAGENDQIVNMEDQKMVIGIFIEKKDWNDKQLVGAHLQVIDSNNIVIDDWMSDGSVHRVQGSLEIGKKYRLHEESSPEGYEVSQDIEFEVKNTEENQIITMVDNKIIIRGEPFVKIIKIDKDGQVLEGAELQLLDSNGNVIEDWMSNDKAHNVDAKLEVGKQYTLREKTPPKGYEKAEDIVFTAKADEQEIKMTDNKIRRVAGVVETLDEIGKYFEIFFVAIVILVVSIVLVKKLNGKKLSK